MNHAAGGDSPTIKALSLGGFIHGRIDGMAASIIDRTLGNQVDTATDGTDGTYDRDRHEMEVTDRGL